jgi:hypothetical protein
MSKIAFASTHGVGKTALVSFLAFYYKQMSINCEIIPEIARELLLTERLPINDQTTLEAQWRIQNVKAKREIDYEDLSREGKFDHIICDRTRWDDYAYPRLKFGKAKTEAMRESILQFTKNHPYQLIYRIPIWKPDITKDGVRSDSKEFQLAIDSLITEIFEENGVEHIVMPTEIFRLPRKEQIISLVDYFDRTTAGIIPGIEEYNKN